jgi:two-component system sensor histidine kinase UhpB
VTDEGLREEVSSLQHRTMELAEGVRNLSHDLHPGVLQHIGLPAALTTFCDDLRRQHPLTVELDMGGDFDRLSSDGALCLYRIAQEALRNVAQHAGAHHVEVTLRRAGDQVALSIADDGAGFDPTSTRLSGRGLGLVSMRERIRSMGGRIEITSDVGQGTRITAQIPVQSPTLA